MQHPRSAFSKGRAPLRLLKSTLAIGSLAAALAAVPSSCGGSGDGAAGSGAGAADPCAGNSACGKPCASDAECDAALHCGPAGSCTATCSASAPCPSGETCGDRGRCGPLGGGGGPGGSTTGGQGGDCPDIDVAVTKQVPTVLVLVDQSSSMNQGFDNGSRWDVLRDTLLADSGIFKTLESEVRFGLVLYSAKSSDDETIEGQCPLLDKVPIALSNYDEIEAKYEAAAPIDETPTGDSIAAITPELVAFAEPGPKVIVLATDGEPDTCAKPNPQQGQGESIAAVQAAYKQGIQTDAISVGEEVGEAHLQEVANAGLGKPLDGDAPYFVATKQADLIAAFNQIINGARTCVFTLDGNVEPGKEAEGSVTLDGAPLAYEDANGWDLTKPNEITLLGDACATIQSGDHAVKVVFPCGTVTDIPK